jgi:hypothetical protein
MVENTEFDPAIPLFDPAGPPAPPPPTVIA